MSEEKSYRKLTTVLSADAVGFSRLMANDEAGTITFIKQLQDEIFLPASERFQGRIIKLMGDGLLMEFSSVVDAVNFSVQVQSKIAEANNTRDAAQRMDFRIGINIGDVVSDGDDILGHGVNVAARLEAMAEPGGICVSGTVHEHVKGKVPFGFQDLGTQQIKNIPEPVAVFSVVASNPEKPQARPTKNERSKSALMIAGASVIALLAVIGVVTWTGIIGPNANTAATERLAFPLPDKPSIAVLPFDNLSDIESEEFFADGITADLITDLSKVSGLFVIARDSTFAFKGQELTIGTIAETLGVRYVLVGSVRQSGGALRVNTQLVDTTTGENVWAERFDGEIADVFAVQDHIVVTTVDALRLNLTDTEKEELSKRETQQLDAKAAFQQGWQLFSRFNERDNARSVPHFEEAIHLDPEYGRAYGALALVYLRGSAYGWDKALGEQEANLRHVLAPKYLKLAEEHGTTLVHVVRAMQDLFYRHTAEPMGTNSGTDDAKREASAAIALQPSDPEAHVLMGWALTAAGQPTEGLNFVEAAKRLNPNYPSHYVFFEAAAYFALNKLETAASVLRDGLDRDPDAAELFPIAASVFASLGLRQEAAAMLERWRPGQTAKELEFAIEHYAFPISWSSEHNWLNTRLTDGLRLAAVPEEVTVLSLRKDASKGDVSDRVLSIRRLGWFGPRASAAVPMLIEALSDPSNRIRREAAITLGKIGPAAEPAVETLQAIKNEPIVGFHAARAIERIFAQ